MPCISSSRTVGNLYAAFNVSQPVFEGGALGFQLRLARASWQDAVLSYQQTVQNALEQVSNSLVACQKDREFREQQELLTQAAQQTHHLSEVLYKNGGASYLQVLTSETNYFSAELNLVEAQVSERLALVQLSNWDTNATGLRNIMPFRDWLAQPHQVDCSGGQGHLGPRSFDPVPRSEPRPQDTEEVLGKSCGCVVRD